MLAFATMDGSAAAPSQGSGALLAPNKVPDRASADRIEHGRYLAQIGDCAACHTSEAAKRFAGGVAIETGFGSIFSPNITSDRETGVGSWSKDDFYRALHTGHDDEGKY